MFQDITWEEVQQLQEQGEIALIDVRSPSEFKDATIPGSVNIPLFDDEERAIVGTAYKQESVEAAKQKGLEIVAAKLPDFVRAIGEVGGAKKAVFCWRGGMRSKTSATLAALMDHQMYRIIGGYRAYRNWVVNSLEQISTLPPCYCINGYTGVGKTLIIDQLAKRGYPVVDLEGMAQHRGSIFGHIGRRPVNQKTFESRLLHRLIELRNAPYLIIEAESTRIGKVQLPDFLLRAKQQGKYIFIELPFQQRVRQIVSEYDPAQHQVALLEAFQRIAKRIHTPIAAAIRNALLEQDFETAVHHLLENYYDPRYAHAFEAHTENAYIITANHVDEALDQMIKYLPDPH